MTIAQRSMGGAQTGEWMAGVGGDNSEGPAASIQFSSEFLRRLIREAVAETLERQKAAGEDNQGRLAYREEEAAEMLGVNPWVLRDCRRRGEIQGSRVGSKILYTRPDLQQFLEQRKDSC
jgi:hypothetical protein